MAPVFKCVSVQKTLGEHGFNVRFTVGDPATAVCQRFHESPVIQLLAVDGDLIAFAGVRSHPPTDGGGLFQDQHFFPMVFCQKSGRTAAADTRPHDNDIVPLVSHLKTSSNNYGVYE